MSLFSILKIPSQQFDLLLITKVEFFKVQKIQLLCLYYSLELPAALMIFDQFPKSESHFSTLAKVLKLTMTRDDGLRNTQWWAQSGDLRLPALIAW